jgi:WD40 repeat protein
VTQLQMIDVATGAKRAEVELPWWVHGLDVSPDGRTAVAAGLGGVAVVDLAQATVIAQRDLEQRQYPQRPTSVAISPDGTRVALGREVEILVLDARTLADVTAWPADPYDVPLDFAWLDEGATLAHGGVQGRLAFRSIPDGKPIGAPREVAPGFTLDLATNPDATRLATLGTDGEIILWDPATKQAVGEPLVPATDLLWGWIRFGSDDRGEFIEVQYETARAVRYPIDTNTLIARACAIAGREPTTAEWQAMHGDAPQRPTCGPLSEGDLLALP